MKGFRQQPNDSRKERLRGLETELQNMQMAGRISQMMLQQAMKNMQAMQQDLGSAMGLINELQYKILGVQRLTGLDNGQLAVIADELRLKDFNEASDKEDAKEGFTKGIAVDNDSTVIITSTTKEVDKGIFRSKIKLAECGVPDLIKALEGKEVGTKALVQLNGVEHEVELLSVLQPPKSEPVPQVAPEGNA